MNRLGFNKNREAASKTILIFCLILFFMLAFAVYFNFTLKFDQSFLIELRQNNNLSVPLYSSWLLPVMKGITYLGNANSITFITAFITLYLIIKKEYKLAGIILTAIIGGSLLDLLLKSAFARTRPLIVPHLVEAEYYSFPSGHAFISSVLYPAACLIFIKFTKNKILKRIILPGTVIIILLIGFSRLYLGVHYPSDVLGGWAIGISWSSFWWILSEKITKYPLVKGS